MGIEEVAKIAKVSIATVSRTINNSPAVDPRTARRVWRAIRKLDYFPNTQARSLVSGKSRFLGLIVSDIVNPFFPELIKAFEENAIQRDYEVILNSTGYDSARMTLCVRRMLERKVDGVAIMTSEMAPALIQQFSSRGIPMVFLDVATAGKSVSNVLVDYASGIHQAVEHLCALHHRRIAFISGPLNLKSAGVRRSAFINQLASLGIADGNALVREGDHKIEGGLRAMQELLKLKPRPTAVLASNDLTAIGALRAIRQAGRCVPGDISVIGYDDILMAEYTDPPLTTIRLSRAEIAAKAFEALAASINNRSTDGAEYKVSTSLVVRESTGPASP